MELLIGLGGGLSVGFGLGVVWAGRFLELIRLDLIEAIRGEIADYDSGIVRPEDPIKPEKRSTYELQRSTIKEDLETSLRIGSLDPSFREIPKSLMTKMEAADRL